MINIKLKKNDNENKEWPVCPEYTGIAKIVDATELKVYHSKEYGDKEKFRLLIELNAKGDNDKNWVVSTMPFTPSVHEKSALFAFAKSIGLNPASPDFDLAQLSDYYLEVIVKHVTVEGKTFANIVFVSPAKKDAVKFKSTYVARTPAPAAQSEDEHFGELLKKAGKKT